jgi:hypothetical protein
MQSHLNLDISNTLTAIIIRNWFYPENDSTPSELNLQIIIPIDLTLTSISVYHHTTYRVQSRQDYTIFLMVMKSANTITREKIYCLVLTKSVNQIWEEKNKT